MAAEKSHGLTKLNANYALRLTTQWHSFLINGEILEYFQYSTSKYMTSEWMSFL